MTAATASASPAIVRRRPAHPGFRGGRLKAMGYRFCRLEQGQETARRAQRDCWTVAF
ncbi:hypothetical protein [Azospirillum sp. TSH58]|uniref:hypothetical protein n=1 Tax=Azospirillum sp. TSH58 TaxID=664962 RepID=UPI001B3B8750|nr:hypothetical protein [Azospirillum sp. TSH58]